MPFKSASPIVGFRRCAQAVLTNLANLRPVTGVPESASTRSSRKERRRMFLVSAMVLACLGATPVLAADYPTQPVKIIVPFSPGGGTDIIGRIVAQKLGEELGTQFIVENKPGAAGTIGADVVAKAEPNGYTLLVYHIAMVTAHHIQKNMQYDPLKDFTPISRLSVATNVAAVNANLPVKNFADFVALAKKEPGKLHLGSSGAGGSDHLAGELLQLATNIKLTHVPYKGGGPATAAAASGEVQITTGTISQASAMINAGKLRPLAVLQKERNSSLPNVPSAAEAGYPDLFFQTWFGMWGPANMSADVVQKLSAALKKVLALEDVGARLAKVGVQPSFSTPKELADMNKQQFDQWNEILKGKFQ